MNELGDSLERMSFMQLLLLFGFVTTYVMAVGGLFGTAVRLRAAAAALVQAVAFAALTEPWVHGALLVVFVVAVLGLFVMLSWLLARLLAPRPLPGEAPADTVSDTAGDTVGDTSVLPSQPLAPRAAPKLGRRARATR